MDPTDPDLDPERQYCQEYMNWIFGYSVYLATLTALPLTSLVRCSCGASS